MICKRAQESGPVPLRMRRNVVYVVLTGEPRNLLPSIYYNIIYMGFEVLTARMHVNPLAFNRMNMTELEELWEIAVQTRRDRLHQIKH